MRIFAAVTPAPFTIVAVHGVGALLLIYADLVDLKHAHLLIISLTANRVLVDRNLLHCTASLIDFGDQF